MPPPEPPHSHSKAALRNHFRAARRALSSQERDVFSARIVAHLLRWLDARPSYPATLALYLATTHEANLDAMIEPLLARGVRVVAPHGDGFALVHASGGHVEALGSRWREASGAAIRTEEIDMVLLPGVAFGRDGSRLGQGGGWYDRALQGSGAALVGVCFSCQVADALPVQEHDLPVRWVACEEGIARAHRYADGRAGSAVS